MPAPPDAPSETARPPGAAYNDLREALPRLPEVFDKRDIACVLGYKPPYTTLVRALELLKESGEIAEEGGLGYRRSFRKVAPEGWGWASLRRRGQAWASRRSSSSAWRQANVQTRAEFLLGAKAGAARPRRSRPTKSDGT